MGQDFALRCAKGKPREKRVVTLGRLVCCVGWENFEKQANGRGVLDGEESLFQGNEEISLSILRKNPPRCVCCGSGGSAAAAGCRLPLFTFLFIAA